MQNNEIFSNHPPYAPSNYYPCSEFGSVDIDVNLSWDGGDPDPGDTVTYGVFFGPNPDPPLVAWIGPYPWNQTLIEYDPGTLTYCEDFYMKIIACDNHDAMTMGYECRFFTICNNPPEAPVIDGPYRWPVGKELCFTFHSTDPDNDSIKYIINWGDGTTNETDFYPACTPVEVCHTWDKMGIYVIKVWAVDEWGNSAWSEFEIIIPRTWAIPYTLFQCFFERFPMLERLLSLIK